MCSGSMTFSASSRASASTCPAASRPGHERPCHSERSDLCHPERSALCHPERSEGSLGLPERSLALLGMTEAKDKREETNMTSTTASPFHGYLPVRDDWLAMRR